MRAVFEPMTVTLTRPFASNRGVIRTVRQTLVQLSWEGLTGYGTALNTEPGEAESCTPLLEDATPYTLRRTLAQLAASRVRPAVVAGIDLALHDLLGKAAGRPLREIFGLAGMPVPPTAMSLEACSADQLAERGAAYRDWPILKLKLTAADDGSRVGYLRRGYPGRIWIDGNGSWEPRRALQVATELARHDVEILEQPVPAGNPDALRLVHQHSPVPVFADEDCSGPQDIARLRHSVSGVNIKLNKCGGLRAALDMIILARASGLQIMLGCKNESSLGVTAMAHLAALADHLDLDGTVRLLNDPFRGLDIDRGIITLPDTPGLGVTAEGTGPSIEGT